MIPSIIKYWEDNKGKIREEVRALFLNKDESYYFTDYGKLLKIALNHLSVDNKYRQDNAFDSDIKEIDFGEYQGTLIFIFSEEAYQPSIDETYYTYVEYGSCSGCDTLLSIMANISVYNKTEEDFEKSIDDIMTLILHMVQRIKRMGDNND